MGTNTRYSSGSLTISSTVSITGTYDRPANEPASHSRTDSRRTSSNRSIWSRSSEVW